MRKRLGSVKRCFEWAGRHKFRAAVLLVGLSLLSPPGARSQFLDPCCAILAAGLSTISSTLTNIIGGGLAGILSVEKNISNFEQNVVWPRNLIAQAQSLVGGIQGIFSQMQGVLQVPVNSASLPATRKFEQAILSGNPSQIAGTSAQYTAVYGAVPGPTAASPEMRNMIDITDATAQAAMKKAIEIDALAALEIRAANQINQSIVTAAPGSAPIIEAQADAWLVRANAYTQSATADLMRVRAIALANDSENLKNGAASAAAIQQQIYNLLKRQ